MFSGETMAILGASVSHQTVAHDTREATGYVKFFIDHFQERLGLEKVEQITYPGNRLSDGGLIRALDVVSAAPEICLIEPLIEDLNRGKNFIYEEAAFIYRRLVDAGILPITLLLPVPKRLKVQPQETAYKIITSICNTHGLPMIEINLEDVDDIDGKFVGVHTRPEGGMIYAERLFHALNSRRKEFETVRERLPRMKGRIQTPICHTRLPKGTEKTYRSLTMKVRSPTGRTTVSVVQRQMVGPFSPVNRISLRSDDKKISETDLGLWDPYCHYARASFALLARVPITSTKSHLLTVACGDKDPNYAECRREIDTWPPAEERYIEPRGDYHIFSTDPDLEVTIEEIR